MLTCTSTLQTLKGVDVQNKQCKLAQNIRRGTPGILSVMQSHYELTHPIVYTLS